jgi:membrane-bound lytic murein transglycosylase B
MFAIPAMAADDYAQRQEVRKFISELVEQEGFNQSELEQLFARAQKQQSILDAISRPAESKPWYQYRPIFLTDKRAEKGVEFWIEHGADLERAEKEFGVAQEIIVAIIGVETYYGRRTGSYAVLDALSTLGFDYPPRSRFFSKELREYLLLARNEGWDPLEIKGSYAGAMGFGQFIPSSYRAYAVDFSGDGKRDLWNATDAIGSVANYFKRHGWKQGEGVAVKAIARDDRVKELKTSLKPSMELKELSAHGVRPRSLPDAQGPYSLIALEQKDGYEYWVGQKNFYVISRYNHSALYSMAVYQLSQDILQRYEKRLASK